MYKLAIENIVAFTNWWVKQDKKRPAKDEDVQRYFMLPII